VEEPQLHLFGPLKEHLASNRFATDCKLQHAVISWSKAPDTYFFHARVDSLMSPWDKCLVATVWKSDVYQNSMSSMHLCKDEIHHIEVLVALFLTPPCYTDRCKNIDHVAGMFVSVMNNVLAVTSTEYTLAPLTFV
jgi:hypothetical protein